MFFNYYYHLLQSTLSIKKVFFNTEITFNYFNNWYIFVPLILLKYITLYLIKLYKYIIIFICEYLLFFKNTWLLFISSLKNNLKFHYYTKNDFILDKGVNDDWTKALLSISIHFDKLDLGFNLKKYMFFFNTIDSKLFKKMRLDGLPLWYIYLYWHRGNWNIEVIRFFAKFLKVRHMWHLVDNSPWPFITASGVFFFLFGLTLYMHNIFGGGLFLSYGLFVLITGSICWLRDVVFEGTFLGQHTRQVQKALKSGMLFFILSEIMFFFAFFWAFFYVSFAVDIWLGNTWPPRMLFTASSTGIALLNTVLLLSSGITITLAQKGVKGGLRFYTYIGFFFTLFYACFFLSLQFYEYCNLTFSFGDSVYGSCFFILTGLHGLHVIVGTLFIFICLYRFVNYHFSKRHFVGLTSASWYWHFVDGVWVLLYGLVYLWGNIYIETSTVASCSNYIDYYNSIKEYDLVFLERNTYIDFFGFAPSLCLPSDLTHYIVFVDYCYYKLSLALWLVKEYC